jgi:hypothetical protein
MMNATTEATKLNFMTDHGSTRASVSIAWRLVDLRVWMVLAEPRFCQAEETELARPAAAPVMVEAAAPVENPLLDERSLSDDGPVPAPPAGAGRAGAGADPDGAVASAAADQAVRE